MIRQPCADVEGIWRDSVAEALRTEQGASWHDDKREKKMRLVDLQLLTEYVDYCK